MAGRCIPEQPAFLPASRYRAERRVWEALRRRLRPTDALLHSVPFTGKDGNWEVDLVLLLPEGFAVVEVKGNRVWYANGQCHQRTPEGEKVIDLEEQAKSGRYLVERYLRAQPEWLGKRVRMAHFVALPDTDVPADADLGPGLPRERIIDRSQLADALGLIHDVLTGVLKGEPAHGPGTDGVELAADLLGGVRDAAADLADRRDLRAEYVAELTERQGMLLDAVAAWPRFQVVGGPGTGKTYLALEQARRWAEAGNRVAFVAYSLGLTTWVSREVAAWHSALRERTTVTTFHGLGSNWGAVPETATQEQWELDIPERMRELAAELPREQRFDAIVVDEAQDFGATWWPALLAALRDPESGRLATFGDVDQAIFRTPGSIELGPPPLELHTNLRNCAEVGALVNAIRHGASMRLLGGPGFKVRFVDCPSKQAVHAADKEVDSLLEAGWLPADIALLTTGHRHGMQREAVEWHGRDGYWEQFWDGDQVFCATVAGFKGLERPAVVLAVDDFLDPATARDILLVGMSRARDLLAVCGDRNLIAAVGGKELAKRLFGQ